MAERNDVATRLRATGDPSERSAEEIRQDIAAKRETITETVDRLGERIHESLDWREYVGQYPYVALGLAAGVGLLVSGIFKPRPSPTERMVDALADSVEEITDRFKGSLGDVIPKKTGPGKTVKAAITASIATAATNYIKGQVSSRLGFGGNSDTQSDSLRGRRGYAKSMNAGEQGGF
ncbi:MAG TPA: hypothetical protein VNH22_14975 [Blastocatellia bacterium]|jgi:ElaB/YqjD/DUF883 family membrane-anchored ribosome-binding protein|nr:hypothetical protein [Blastocatellia bacterium]